MAIFKGTIAGIGEKVYSDEEHKIVDEINSVNLIYPKFDAEIRKYIVGGGDRVLDGLVLNGTALSAGVCYTNGYVGELNSAVNFDTVTGKDIYAVFIVKNDVHEEDEFFVTNDLENDCKKTVTYSYTVPDGGTLRKYNLYGHTLIIPNGAQSGYRKLVLRKKDGTTEEYGTNTGDYDDATNFRVKFVDNSYNVENDCKEPIVNDISKESGAYALPLYVGGVAKSKRLAYTESDVYVPYQTGQYVIEQEGIICAKVISEDEGANAKITITETGAIVTANVKEYGYAVVNVIYFYFENGESNGYQYPVSATHSDFTKNVAAYGELGENVTCPTPLMGTRDETVANCEFVYNEIERQIDYQKLQYTNTITVKGSEDLLGGAGTATLTFNADFYHKSNYVIVNNISITATLTGIGDVTIKSGAVIGKVDTVFAPETKKVICGINTSGSSGDAKRVEINSDGELVLANDVIISEKYSEISAYTPFSVGYDKLT